MRPLLQLAAARRARLVLALTLTVLAACVVWRDQGIVLDYFPPSPPVGLAPDELGSMVLAAFLPALAVNPLSTLERLAPARPRRVLTAYTVVVALIPGLTAIVWTSAVRVAQPLDQVPPVAPRAASFALLGLIGLLLTLTVGSLWGPVISLVLSGAFVIAQNAYGADLAGHVLSTGDRWHTNPWIDAVALIAAAALTYRRAGVPTNELA